MAVLRLNRVTIPPPTSARATCSALVRSTLACSALSRARAGRPAAASPVQPGALTQTTAKDRSSSTVTSTPALSQAATRLAASPRGKSAGPGLRPVPQLEIGDRVNHDAFGLGTVTATRGAGDSTQAEVDFGPGTGIKWLLLRYAPLEKL